jgi:hypothetical protein
MNEWRYAPVKRHDVVTIPILWLAIALSLLVHLTMLVVWLPRLRLLPGENAERGTAGSPLVAQLVPRPGPPESSAAAPPPAPAADIAPVERVPPRRMPPPVKPRPPSAPVLAQPGPGIPSPSPPAAPPAPPAPPGDFASYVEARRLARGEAPSSPSSGSAPDAPPVDDEIARKNRIVAANLGMNVTPTFGQDPKNGGGVFHVERLGYNDAEFYFFGWNKDIGRRSKQLIEVKKGNNSDIKLAVIRKMITIIREHETGDFSWESHRLNREVTLSARTGDNAGLEDFMMQEFFGDPRHPY